MSYTKEETGPTFNQHVVRNKSQHLIDEIKEIKAEVKEAVDNFAASIVRRTELILRHAVKSSSSEDEEDEYSSIHGIRDDKQRMQNLLEMIYKLEAPLHPYCEGCNREGEPHPGQWQHMGENGCLDD